MFNVFFEVFTSVFNNTVAVNLFGCAFLLGVVLLLCSFVGGGRLDD